MLRHFLLVCFCEIPHELVKKNLKTLTKKNYWVYIYNALAFGVSIIKLDHHSHLTP